MIESVKCKKEFQERFDRRYDELKWLYCELYNNDMKAFDWLCNSLYDYYTERKNELKSLDRKREKNPDWYKTNGIVGMMMYVDAFADNLKGVRAKIDYIKKCGVNYLHLMPILKTPKNKSDGGYAVADFREVQPEFGTMRDLENLTSECHKNKISCCLDFVMNHTSDEHEWARAARNGDTEAQKKYFFFDNWDYPHKYEQTVPQVFPTTAPGNFTYLNDCNKIVMTTFYPYQWDLNNGNCVVFNDMVGNMLYLANRGIDIIRLDAVPYIWKEIGTTCRNLPRVHTIVRMMRIITEIVCPSVLLLGEVVMEPSKVVPYFGITQKPECHLLYNVTTMASTWHTLATRDVRLLKHQMDKLAELPKDYVFLNYLRCHDDIGWGLDYEWLKQFAISEIPHKKYLNDFLTGRFPGSNSRGELYNDDPRLGDARLCGTTASLCGIEAALYERNVEKLNKAVDCDIMLHAYMLTQSGIPVLYSGDEIGQLNDYGYYNNPEKCADSRYLHRGKFNWKSAENCDDTSTFEGRLFQSILKLEKCRAENSVFGTNAGFWTVNTGSDSVLGICREAENNRLLAYFNFSENEQTVFPGGTKSAKDLLSGDEVCADSLQLKPYGFIWLLLKSF